MTIAPNPTATQLGAALRIRRKGLGLTQVQSGERLSLRQSTISAVEGGKVDTRLSTLLDMLAALGLELILRPLGAADSGLKELL